MVKQIYMNIGCPDKSAHELCPVEVLSDGTAKLIRLNFLVELQHRGKSISSGCFSGGLPATIPIYLYIDGYTPGIMVWLKEHTGLLPL